MNVVTVSTVHHKALVCECNEDHFEDSFAYSVTRSACPYPVRRSWATFVLTAAKDGIEFLSTDYASKAKAEIDAANLRAFIEEMEGR